MSDWIKKAKVGDKVVCVNHDLAPGWLEPSGDGDPEIGKVFTIDDIYEEDGLIWIGLVGFKLFDYWAGNFRPVQPRKTDISIFTDMLRKASKPVEECA